MARQPRLDEPGTIHHVMFRGVGGCPIFRDDVDRETLLCRLERVFEETKTGCLSWALMTTHGHLASRTGVQSVSRVMQRVLTGYAMDFNNRHRRNGHLFQDRFKSFVVDDATYLDELVRYIHLNPLRGGVVSSLDELETYRWTSLPALMDKRPRRIVSVEAVLSRFGQTREEARRGLRASLEEGALQSSDPVDWPSQPKGFASHDRRNNDPGTSFDRRLHTKLVGHTGLLDEVLAEVASEDQARERLRRSSWTPELAVLWVCDVLSVDAGDVILGRRNRNASRARAVAAHLIVERLGETTYTAARALGVTASAISQRLRRGRALCEERSLRLPLTPPASLVG